MWFFKHFFALYLFHRSRNNRRDKQRSKILARKNVQKTTFEAAEMMLSPWNQQYVPAARSTTKHCLPQDRGKVRNLRAIFCKSHPTCDSRVFRISSYFNQLKIKVILAYGQSFNFIRHFVEFLGGRETTVVSQEVPSVSTSYIKKAHSAS